MNLNCKNCGTELRGEYCHKCGQKLITKRITVKELTKQFLSSFFNTENGLIYTLISLITKPHKVVHDYINGNTVRYTNPARFAFFTFAIIGFLTIKLGLLDQDISSFNELTDMNNNETAKTAQAYYVDSIKDFLSIFSFLAIFFYSFVARLLWRRFNYAEHMVLQLYCSSLGSIASFLILIFVAGRSDLIFLQYLITLLIYITIYFSVFRNNIILTTIKSIISYALGSFLLIISTGILFGIVTVVKLFFGSSF
jgi:hypothetical protein